MSPLWENKDLLGVQWFDEQVLTNYFKSDQFAEMHLRIYWPTILLNQERGRDSHQEYHLDKWQCQDGKMLRLESGKIVDEVMYLHFINWKKTMESCELKFTDSTDSFYISYSAIHYHLHSNFEKGFNIFNNLFDGYFIREKKDFFRRLKKKFRGLYKLNL